MHITPDEFYRWKENPVTEKFFCFIRERLDAEIGRFISGEGLDDPTYNQKCGALCGATSILQSILYIDFDEFTDPKEESEIDKTTGGE